MKTILVPLDGSPLSERALPYARVLARAVDGKIILVRSAQARTFPGTDPTDEQVRAVEDAEAYLDGIATRLSEEGIQSEVAVPYGLPAEEIVAEVAIRDPDLVVMSTHGRGGLGRWIYGSVADQVIRDCRKPILLIPATCERLWTLDRPIKVVVPLDGSPLAEAVFATIEQLATGYRSDLVVIRAVEPLNYAYAEGYAYVALDPEAELAEARDYVNAAAARLRETGLKVEAEVRSGYAAPTIEAVARARQADLIAMSTHGRGGLARLVMGSVATGTLQRSSVPLLLIRPAVIREFAETEPAPAANPLTEDELAGRPVGAGPTA
ncbi:MAG: universal stress protein [Chloroflexi bacterium]|nr:universal stress protein [Chloroflexota bacterium]